MGTAGRSTANDGAATHVDDGAATNAADTTGDDAHVAGAHDDVERATRYAESGWPALLMETDQF